MPGLRGNIVNPRRTSAGVGAREPQRPERMPLIDVGIADSIRSFVWILRPRLLDRMVADHYET